MNKLSSVPVTQLFATILIVLSVIVLGRYYYSVVDGIDFTGHLVGRDFANIYLGGKLIGQGQIAVLFRPEEYWLAMRDWLGQDYPVHNWSYPPTIFWVAEQLSRLPYFAAYGVWTLGGIALLSAAIRKAGLGWIWVPCIVLSPAGLWNILAGQSAFYVSALIVFAVSASQSNSKLSAGFFWTMATIKPHLGLLAIPLLIGKKRYGVIAVGAILFLLLAGVVLVRYGTEPWLSFFDVTVRQQRFVLEQWHGQVETAVPTAFIQGRLLGFPIWAAYMLHGLVFVAGAVLLVRAWNGPGSDFRYWLTWFTLGTFLLLPYSFIYDLVLLHVVLALWSRDARELFCLEHERTGGWVWIMLWVLPPLLTVLASLAKIQAMPFVLLWMLWRLGCDRARI